MVKKAKPAARAKLVQVKEALLSVQHDKHRSTTLYVLASDREWLQDPNNNQRIAGPAIVLVERTGQEEVAKRFGLKQGSVWEWLQGLARAGQWALTNKRVVAYLPEDLVRTSPRFNGTTKPQRQRMQQKRKRT